MRREIDAALTEVEQEHAVRILVAVESGSRAWGFASRDSDYDVRFIYCHPEDWYLQVFEQRDVIEPRSDGVLDPSGWELRKALRLFSKCNLALYEWLNSPIVYREAAGFRSQLQALIPAFFNPIVAIHHYLSMARAAFDTRDPSGHMRVKKLFYTLRALFACRWVEQIGSQPPTEFSALLAKVAHPNERDWINNLLAIKAAGDETASITLTQQRREAIERELTDAGTYAARAPRPSKGNTDPLDAISRQWITDC
jgi:predicted nucleotidyltransferase